MKLLDAVSAFQGLDKKTIFKILTLTIVSYAFFVLAPWILAQGMDFAISIRTLAWMRALVFFVTLIPITVAGLGMREASFIALLSLYGIEASSAVAFSVLLFAIQLAIGFIGGLFELNEHLLTPLYAQWRGKPPQR